MLEFSKYLKPFSSKKGCGDFALLIESKDSYLVCVGDIGGHGNIKFETLRSSIKKTIEQNKEKTLYEITELLKNLEEISKFGLVFFLAKIEKILPICQYICIGDLKLNLIRDESIKSLKRQEGILGLESPINIVHNVIKLKSNDIIVISTDGLSNYEEDYFKIIQKNSTVDNITKILVENYALKNDDALSCVLRYEKKNIYNKETTNNISSKKVENKNYSIVNKSETLKTQTTSKITLSSSSKLLALDKNFLLTSIDKSSVSKKKIESIIKYFNFEPLISIKIQSIILEMIKKSNSNINIYVSNNYFQIQTNVDEEFTNKIVSLLNNASFYFDKNNNFFIIEYFINDIDINSKEFKEFKEMSKLGLDEEAYKTFKIDKEKNLKILLHQSRLASMGEMIGAIAHQWRQPLNELSIRIQKIKYAHKDNNLDEDYMTNFIQKNIKTIDFMSQTIDDFRGFFRLDKVKESFSIKKAIEEILNIQESQLKNHYIYVDLKGNSFNYLGIKTEFQQVILNLISNSKDAFESNQIDKRLISIKIYNKKIVIIDNAGGVDDSIINDITKAYFTTKKQNKGTGMGLYMSKMIIEDSMCGKMLIKNFKDGLKIEISL